MKHFTVLALFLVAAGTASAAPKPIFRSKVIDESTPGHAVAIDVALPAKAETLYLFVSDGGNGYGADWADWVEPRFVMADGSEKKLTDLKWSKAAAEWGQVRKQKNAGGGELRVNGLSIKDGIGTHANSIISYGIPKGAKRFKGSGGLDNGGTDQGGSTSVQFLLFTEDPSKLIAKRSSGGGSSSHDPADAVAQLDVHPELEATLFASEPMLLSPSSIDVDHRGRVWVCEVVNYRGHRNKRPEGDRILIVEDTNGDNKADKSTVFYQGRDIDSAHGICVLGDRVIVSAGDDVFYLIDEDGDDKADRKELLFTKIGGAQHDHGIHAFHFGPDGKLYFNFGNAGKQLCDKDGKIITDRAGNEVRAGNLPYQEGMIFRCDLDGSNVETLAWNFRNNWEVCVDSFGRLWQSDNDDDGNRGVRINYVLPYGNYGYRDEISRAGWRDERPGIETEIPLRHWHLNDPGVVPNLLQTGAGSPTGICVYEGDLLPKVFHGQPIHCDAGPNVVRAYPTTKKGAGFEAEALDILKGTRDRWFRPSDVCVAPDGSLIVADWYDPGVGGHGMGDLERGRLFLVAPEGHKHSAPKLDLESTEGLIAALGSPNEATRYLAYTTLKSWPWTKVHKLFFTRVNDESVPDHLRARYLWILATISKTDPTPITNQSLRQESQLIRSCAIRAHGLLAPTSERTREYGPNVLRSDPQVRATSAIAHRFWTGTEADHYWALLATTYKGNDRWFLEALGIGADLHWKSRFAAYLKATDNKPHPDIVWRARCEEALPFLQNQILAAQDPGEQARFLRALHFHPKSEALEKTTLALFAQGSPELATLIALHDLDRGAVERAGALSRLEELSLARTGTTDLVKLATRYNQQSEGIQTALLEFIVAHPGDSQSPNAARHLLGKPDLLEKALSSGNLDSRRPVAIALGRSGDKRALKLLATALGKGEEADTRRVLVEALVLSRQGESQLLQLARDKKLSADMVFTTAALLGRSRDAKIRDEIAKILNLPPAPGTESLPPIAELVRMRGNAGRGAAAFEKATCATCHQVKGKGINFGPDLSEIGSKLPSEALYEAILYPSNAVAHGYAAIELKTASGDDLLGFVTSETDNKLSLRMAGGLTRELDQKDISSKARIETSLMPPGLAALLNPQELADLIAYLQTLKK